MNKGLASDNGAMLIGRSIDAPGQTQESPAWGSRKWLLLLMAIALLLRLPGMQESLWLDEVFVTRVKVGDPITLMRTILSDYHPPAYLVTMHVWGWVFGDSEISVRMLPLISGMLSILVIRALGCRLAGARAGFLAAMLLALSPTHIWYSHEARPYATVLLMVLLATLAWYRLAEPRLTVRDRRRWTWVWFASLGFALFTHYYVLAIWAAFVVLPWFSRHPMRKRILWLGLLLGAAFAGSLFLKSQLSSLHTASSYLRSFTPMEFEDLHLDWLLTGHAFTPRMGPRSYVDLLLLPYSLLALACMLVGIYRLLRGNLRRAGHLPGWTFLLLWLAIPALLFALPLLGFTRSYIERSALPVMVWFYLLLAFGLSAPTRPWSVRITTGVTTALLAVLVLVAWQNRHSWTVYKPRPDWRQASHWLDEQLRRLPAGDERVRDLYSLGFHPYALSYYDDRFQMAKRLESNEKAYERMQKAIARIFGSEGFPGAWMLRTLEKNFALDRKQAEHLREGLRLRILLLGEGPEPPAGLPPGPADCFLVTWPGMVESEARIQSLVQSPDYEVLDRQDYRLLSLFHIRKRNR